MHLPATDAARRVARRQVVAICEGLPGDLIAAAELLTDELVTNAVIHPVRQTSYPATITVQIHLTAERLRVEITDHDPAPVHATSSPGTLAEHGWGLKLVAELATTWGVHPLDVGVGKTIWFELQMLGDD
jgi:anti-sigma regulatory factor (Ser/Thr protein kinase)